MKIALYGGAFNPVHNEHINIVKSAISELGLDKVVVIPTAVSPHKRTSLTARPRERLEMCRIAFKGVDGVEVSDCEIKRGGISYSYVTCRRFKKLYKDDELYFIVGADMLRSFHLWREPEEILKCVTLAVCAREDEAELSADIKNFIAKFKTGVVRFGYVGKAVSSTRIRVLSALGEDTGAYVPEAVKKYLKDKNVYAMPNLREVKKYLTDDRWAHTVRVAVCAAENARAARVFEEDAIVAAALHDCAKYLSPCAEELKGFTPPPKTPRTVIHQYAGAYVAERIFGVTDTDILNAVRYHTTGRENMSKLEKLVYLADLLEEGHDFEGVEKLRVKLKRGIDECFVSALERQIDYLKSTGAEISPLTERALKYMKETYDK